MSSVIQLLLGDDKAFAVRSTVLVGAIEHLRRLERWYYRQRSNFYQGTIRLLPSDPPLWSDRTRSSFGEMEAKLYHRRLLGEAKVELYHRRPLKATTY
ncbi:hypothetical protein E6C27_scaffold139G004020 [Cucumis melo var. makuwa]|uniref:Uncharacterized protein n=1 Tax=Cucumis melo var. makuwa TaxID=1194695 RepID=A0A5A7SN34_CUCMM|nr:hypothetical protein E6C27_scaffold139G004020 [Cucumis melo var. makuwa]